MILRRRKIGVDASMNITVKEESNLFDFLVDKLGASGTKVRKLIKHGGVSVDGQVAIRPDFSLQPGQTLEIIRPTLSPPFPILYEDRYIIAVEKPSGILSIATDKETSDTFYRAVNHYVQLRSQDRERIFVVHRLDREVSGIMLFAKSQAIQEILQRSWSDTEKRYCVLVEGHPPKREGTIKGWLRENRIHKVYSCPEGPLAKYAVTHYREIKRYPRYALLEIRLETGRKNQIRAHLSELGCPVAGDKKYGATGNPIRRLALHAFSLSFTHPISGERIKLEGPIPKIFAALSITS
jgi:23S rRNA pseudouridine1911/1915/1917 synthase